MKYLITGLGNPGEEYAFTRHNIGFMALDYIAGAQKLTFETCRYGWMAHWKFKGRHLMMLKPNTYMNLSGKAVQYWLGVEKIELANLLVITDDLALPFGTLRLKGKGSDGGHNGLKSIQETIGNQAYPRLRFGIGNEFQKGRQVNYVLDRWSDEEAIKLDERLERVSLLIGSFVTAGIDRTMSTFNNT